MPDQPTVLTSYASGRWSVDLLDSVTIWQAARATSAATSFFTPIQIGRFHETFLDGATGANNPINVVWNEAQEIWKPTNNLDKHIQCLISIGTGEPNVADFGGSLKSIIGTLKSMATETERTAEEFIRRNTTLHSNRRYFRFNVRRGLEGIGLEEAAKLADIATATRRYLAMEDEKKRMEECAETLRERECTTDFT